MRRPLPSLPRSGPGPVSCYRHQTVVSLLEIFNQRFAMRRREFAMYLGAALASPTLRPFKASAQQNRKIPRVGVLWHAASVDEEGIYFKTFAQGIQRPRLCGRPKYRAQRSLPGGATR